MARKPQTPAAQQISRRLSAWPGSATWLVLQRDVDPLSSVSSLPKWGMLVKNRAPQPQKTTAAVSRLVSTAYITVHESDAGPTPPTTRAQPPG
ncbi:hypothetical protein FZI97_23150 [Mycobacterium sp. CBMA360]|uniref:hypothetical protein n=1 Tax=unclassified Mycolicibacterium TaxID=2636767 RepID=UPI0012DC1274|nr:MULTISPECIES: hypothetical protein [unclassified Mycolicibacterium]MUL48780.1 hypothetical protein [Mycolicibacterium sp. CBMA 360]MUL62235.1 hypothetical protein [Mycolicibacterium sp. CBMA 335]